MTRALEIYGRTETGPVRKENEDHILLGRFVKNSGALSLRLDHDDELVADQGLLLAVADGIGGANGGATASWLALLTLEQRFYGGKRKLAERSAEERLQLAVRQANETLLKVAATEPNLAGMGCTLAGICLTAGSYLVFSTGDSRVYRCRDRVLKLLTVDDTVPSLAVKAGRITVEQAEGSYQRHVLTNFLGSLEFTCQIAEGPALKYGDCLLVCSDGLHDLLRDEEMESLLARKEPRVQELGDGLVAKALENGGFDNVSALLARVATRDDNVASARRGDDSMPNRTAASERAALKEIGSRSSSTETHCGQLVQTEHAEPMELT